MRLELAGLQCRAYNSADGSLLALTYIKGLDVTPTGTFGGAFDNTHRDGQETISVHYEGNAGVENLIPFCSISFTQDSGERFDLKMRDAWFVEAGWNFADTMWAPTVPAIVTVLSMTNYDTPVLRSFSTVVMAHGSKVK